MNALAKNGVLASLLVVMSRNTTDLFKIPATRVVELRTQLVL